MDATTVATAGVQPGNDQQIARAFARFSAAHRLFFVTRTLEELEGTPGVDAALVRHYRTERARLSRELGLGAVA